MEEKINFRNIFSTTLILIIIGWGGLGLLLNFSLPTIGARWLLFVLLVLGTTGISIPITYGANVLFTSKLHIKAAIVIRESITIGVYFALITWLSIGRLLSFPIAVSIASVLIIIEYFLLLRDLSEKKPNVTP